MLVELMGCNVGNRPSSLITEYYSTFLLLYYKLCRDCSLGLQSGGSKVRIPLSQQSFKKMFFQMQVPQGNQQYGGSYGAQRSHVPMGPMNGMSPMNSMGSMAMMGQGSGPMHGNMMSAGMGKMAMQVSLICISTHSY